MTSRTTSRKRNQRNAFTLMEILLVAAILVILASMATVAMRGIGQETTITLARTEIGNFEQAAEAFAITNMRMPQSLDELVMGVNGGKPYIKDMDKTDPWNNEYKFDYNSQLDRCIIRSAGPDGQFNTPDDISNDPNEQNRKA